MCLCLCVIWKLQRSDEIFLLTRKVGWHNLDWTNKEATGEHCNKEGHTLGGMTVTVIEKVRNQDPLYRKEREARHVRRFNTFYKGINRKP